MGLHIPGHSPFPVQMENHWASQPGVDPDRAQLMWFVWFGHDPQVAGLVRLGPDKLAGIDGPGPGAGAMTAHDHADRRVR